MSGKVPVDGNADRGAICFALLFASPAGRGGEPCLVLRSGRKLWSPFTTALAVLELAALLGPATTSGSSLIRGREDADNARVCDPPSLSSMMVQPATRSVGRTFLTGGAKIPNFFGVLRFACSHACCLGLERLDSVDEIDRFERCECFEYV